MRMLACVGALGGGGGQQQGGTPVTVEGSGNSQKRVCTLMSFTAVELWPTPLPELQQVTQVAMQVSLGCVVELEGWETAPLHIHCPP
jgi:hypothetical protein